MDGLHHVLRSISPETKAARDPLGVFREFLAHLETLQQALDKPRPKPPRRRPQRRAKAD